MGFFCSVFQFQQKSKPVVLCFSSIKIWFQWQQHVPFVLNLSYSICQYLCIDQIQCIQYSIYNFAFSTWIISVIIYCCLLWQGLLPSGFWRGSACFGWRSQSITHVPLARLILLFRFPNQFFCDIFSLLWPVILHQRSKDYPKVFQKIACLYFNHRPHQERWIVCTSE